MTSGEKSEHGVRMSLSEKMWGCLNNSGHDMATGEI